MAEPVHTAERLAELQALPLDRKIQISQARIIEWYQKNKGNVAVSFSGGKDSTVLLHLVRTIYPDVPAVFSNTGLEYPEIQRFVREIPNTTIVTPKMTFPEVVTKYGYPLISKEIAQTICESRQNGRRSRAKFDNKSDLVQKYGGRFSAVRFLPIVNLPVRISHLCCRHMKKNPLSHIYNGNVAPFVGTLAEESELRRLNWIAHGCNYFDGKKPKSQPLSFWTEQDVLRYIVEYDLKIASVYGDVVVADEDGNEYPAKTTMCDGCKLKTSGCYRTGCIFCGFGFHSEKGETRFQRLARTHPRQYEYSLGGGQWVDNPKYDPTMPEYDGNWKNWNPKHIWVPSKKGLGMKKVFDMVNEVKGKDFYRYE